MRNVTFSADEQLIEAGRRRAQSEKTTLNEQFRLWLERYAWQEQIAAAAANTMEELQGKLAVGRKLTREEMNER